MTDAEAIAARDPAHCRVGPDGNLIVGNYNRDGYWTGRAPYDLANVEAEFHLTASARRELEKPAEPTFIVAESGVVNIDRYRRFAQSLKGWRGKLAWEMVDVIVRLSGRNGDWTDRALDNLAEAKAAYMRDCIDNPDTVEVRAARMAEAIINDVDGFVYDEDSPSATKTRVITGATEILDKYDKHDPEYQRVRAEIDAEG